MIPRTIGSRLLAVVALAALTGCLPAPSDPPNGGSGGAGGAGGAGGGGVGGGGGGGATVPVCLEAPMRLAAGCYGGQCHDPGSDIRPDLVTPGELEKLIGKAAYDVCPDGQAVLINTTRPFSGVLFQRLNGTCWKQMPRSDAPAEQQITDTQRASLIACLKSWVESRLP